MTDLDLPFGPTPVPDGTRFRLWAPGQEQVRLLLPDRSERLPMAALGDGWFETTAPVGVGQPYQFELVDGTAVPDPASRRQAGDVAGPSLVTDPLSYRWRHAGWTGRPWAETVLYELHVGTFTPAGTFTAAIERLPHLAALGVTAIELMPLADFAGSRGWGYDGVLPYAPDTAYGTPDELKALIDAAHGHGLMVFLDVVYNHFGPEGNYLPLYAPSFFTEDFHTPWGAAIDFRQRPVRDFYIENACYWLAEFRFDGLRFDAVHAIRDPGETHILTEIARTVRRRLPGRHIHLVLENERNEAWPLSHDAEADARLYDGQWNDDAHHVCHVLLTGERNGYYGDFAEGAPERLARALTEGFVYQGEPSPHAGGQVRGEPSADLTPLAFVDFLQNHDQIGNRALGERLSVLVPPEQLKAFQAILLLSPHIPLLFMGEEWGARTPFQYFCDFHGELAEAVRAGRQREFAAFFADPGAEVPDPLDPATFARSRLDWSELAAPEHRAWLAGTQRLLALRARELAPRLAAGEASLAGVELAPPHGLEIAWRLADGARLTLLANVGPAPWTADRPTQGRLLHASRAEQELATEGGARLPPWSAAWYLAEGRTP
ncbi:MAG: malto-oligosyltrehalose trehalohydrolase [Geminicoccaceae bacterium]